MTTDRLDMKSIDFVSKNIESIAELFPNCVTETLEGKRIDFTLLQQELSGDIIDGAKERYRLEWAGKREAIVNANLRTTNTLRPIREDSVDFDKTENIYIEGDNLEVLKILQESYLNKIKMIYIDPPYNTGNDFIYKDDFKKSVDELNLEEGNIDEQRNRLVANSNSSGRYHSDWLSMMYPRLKLARNLLTEDGVIFISIDDNEVHNLRKICDEIFGEMNFIALLSIENNPKGRKNSQFISTSNDYCLIFAKNKENACFEENIPKNIKDLAVDENGNFVHNSGKRVLVGENQYNKIVENFRSDKNYSVYYNSILKDIIFRKETKIEPENIELVSAGYEKYCSYYNNNLVDNTYTQQKLQELFDEEALEFKNGKIYEKNMSTSVRLKSLLVNKKYDAVQDNKIINFEMDFKTTSAGTYLKELFYSDESLFSAPKNIAFIKILTTLFKEKDIYVLDFFAGSGTTADAIFRLNAEDGGSRKVILVQIPEVIDPKNASSEPAKKVAKAAIKFLNSINKKENICEIGKERIRRAGKKIIEEQRLVLESKKAELNKKMNGQMSLGNEKELEIEELRQEIESIEKKIKRLDCGFRVFRLDSSNMKDVYYMPKDYKQEKLELFATNIKEDRETEDLIAQVMLDWGLELSKSIEKIEVEGKEVYKIEDNALYCCFDEEIDEKFIRELAKVETHPLRIVFKDSSFKDDTAKENVAQLIKQLCPDTEIKVI